MEMNLQKSRTVNSGEERDSDFQNDHIMIFKWLVSSHNKQNHNVYKETRQSGCSEEQNKLAENIPEGIQSLKLLYKNLKQLH